MSKRIALTLLLSAVLGGCAMKGSKAEEKYEGHSTCDNPGFTCGQNIPGLHEGIAPSADADGQNQTPSFSNNSNYRPICHMKKDKCECSCEPVN